MKPKIRVLHLIDNLDLGGAQTVLFGCLQNYDHDRFDLTLAALHANRRTVFLNRARKLGVPVLTLSPRRWFPWYLISLPRLLIKGRFDIVQCHLYASNWLGKPLARLLGVPVVISHDHCYDAFRFENFLARSVDRYANLCADAIFVISEGIKEKLVRKERLTAEKFHLIQNGITTLPSPHRNAGTGKRIGAAGRFVFWKQFPRFLKVAKQLLEIDSSYRFILAGNGPQGERLQAISRELGIDDHVSWPGATPSLEPFFTSIDLFILTSDLEDLPMVLLEAFSFRVPTAVVGRHGERAKLGGVTLSLDPGETEAAWARQIHDLLSDQAELERVTSGAAKLVREQYSAKQQVRKMEQVYEMLLKRKMTKTTTFTDSV
jgi:glycosyltransferase involved in cell wall biosynthesis